LTERSRSGAFNGKIVQRCTGEVLTIDAVQPLAQNLATVLQYVID